jgi:hypothetical protein
MFINVNQLENPETIETKEGTIITEMIEMIMQDHLHHLQGVISH